MSILALFYFSPTGFRNSLNWTESSGLFTISSWRRHLFCFFFFLSRTRSLNNFSRSTPMERNLFPTYFSLKSRAKDRQVDARYFFQIRFPLFDEETGKTHRTVYGSIEIDVLRFSCATCAQNKIKKKIVALKKCTNKGTLIYRACVSYAWINFSNRHRWIFAVAVAFTIDEFRRRFETLTFENFQLCNIHLNSSMLLKN